MKRISLLGATGSIGKQVLEVIDANSELSLVAFSFYNNIELALNIIEKYRPQMVASPLTKYHDVISKKYPYIKITNNICDITEINGDDIIVINALVGSSGLKPSYTCLNKGRDLLLANKESLVVAGEILTSLAKEKNVRIIPIDSEHCAIAQVINGKQTSQIDSLVLTASGGALFHLSKEELKNVSVADALKHPSWSMGAKITIDSATMMNKGFEVIEACHLFNVTPDKVKILIHPESIVHSLVSFNDKSMHAQLSVSDMRIPINYAINYPNLYDNYLSKELELDKIGTLHFYPFDKERFSLVDTAVMAFNKKGFYPCVLNASNEVAVNLFLNGKITFDKIESIINECLEKTEELSKGLELKIDNLILVTNKVKQMIEEGGKYESTSD